VKKKQPSGAHEPVQFTITKTKKNKTDKNEKQHSR